MSDKEKEYTDASIFDAVPETVHIVDATTYRLLYLNRSGRTLLGLTPEDDIAEQYCYELLRGQQAPCAYCPLLNSSDAPGGNERFNDKVKKYFKVLDAPLRYQGHEAKIIMCVDVTTSSQHRHELETALQAEAVLNETVQILYAEQDLEKALDLMLAHMGLYLRADRCLILSVDGGAMNCAHEWCRQGIESRKGADQDLPLKSIERWQDALARHNNILIPDCTLMADTYPEEYAFLTKLQIKNCVAAPILIRDNLVSILIVTNLPPEEMDSASMMLLTLSYFIATSMVADQNRKLLEKASYSDVMTGVANRNAFIRDLDDIQRSVDLSPVPVGVIYFDLNGLKPVNDQQGHRAGDRLLMRLADAISLFFRKQEIYRTGGDEFVVLCLDMPEAQFKERLAKIVDHIHSVNNLSVSIGYAWADGGTLSLQQIIADADAKMYAEKQAYYKGSQRPR
ncbi:MAG: sensor domain-containing diguanylate cyclase [Schwartzia sp. (in: firmicutes)]